MEREDIQILCSSLQAADECLRNPAFEKCDAYTETLVLARKEIANYRKPMGSVCDITIKGTGKDNLDGMDTPDAFRDL